MYQETEEYEKHLVKAIERVDKNPEHALAHAAIAVALLLEQANFVKGNY